MGVARDDAGGLVLAILVEVIDVLLLVVGRRRRVISPVEQRTVAVLVAVEHRKQRVRVVGLVGIHRRIGGRADGDRRVGREPD